MKINISSEWEDFLWEEFNKEYFKNIVKFINQEKKNWNQIFPLESDIFNAFNLCNPRDIKVVILWQDPYHWENQAHGLSFSINDENCKFPPSLRNIHKEMISDLDIDNTGKRNLTKWARQWVLLLNSTLTVRRWEANSHEKIWWQEFTDKVINKLSTDCEKLVFVLWGNFAIKKAKLVDNKKHSILSSAHPSPLSASRWFFGSKPFSEINNYLEKNEKSKINWKL